jgi:putative ABC transport system permease protein
VYSTTQRYKEISIRKVLGASEFGLVFQLGRTYFLLLAIAFVIAAPVSYFAAEEWLRKFAYRIDVSPLLFVKAALFILLISLITVGIQSLNAARSNPVDALKEQ